MENIFSSILDTHKENDLKRSEPLPEENAVNTKKAHIEEEDDDIDIDSIDMDEITKEDIDKMLEEADKMETTKLDISGIKRELLELEKLINNNQMLRLKYSSEPLKFEDSEYALHEKIKKLSVFATDPSIYPTLVKLNMVDTLSFLLMHDNIVISVDVLKLLDDLTDDDTVVEDVSGNAITLIDAMIEKGVLKSIISNFSRLEKSNVLHEDGIEATLNVLDHFIEIHPEIIDEYMATDLMNELLQVVEKKDYSDVCLQSSELLFTLLSYKQHVLDLLTKPEVIERVLVLLSYWKNKDPTSLNESEIIENLYNVLCLIIMEPSFMTILKEKEVFDLLMIPIRKHAYARIPAFKAVDYYLSADNQDDLQFFLDKKGLKYVFSALLGKNNSNELKKWSASDKLEFDNHILSIILKLLSFSPDSISYKRVLKKFHENEYEKCDCVLEIMNRFAKQRERFNEMMEKKAFQLTEEEKEDGITEEEKIYEKKIELGLHVQDTARSIVKVLVKDEACKWHIDRKVYEQGWKLDLE